MNDEKLRVESCAAAMHYGRVMRKATGYCAEVFKRHMVEGSVLELGAAEGVMTDLLISDYDDYTIVEATQSFVDEIKGRYPKINAVCSLFEDFQTNRKYKNIILGHVLEHVENPVEILRLCKNWLEDGGKIISAVPNSESLHRKAAVEMKLLSSTKQLNDTDRAVGHRRVYDIDMLKNDFTDAGLILIQTGGYWLKPISNGQIESQWSEEMIDAFMKLGEEYPTIAGEIYVIAESVKEA